MNAFDPLDLSRLEDLWADLQIHALTELRLARRENDHAYGRYVAETFNDIRRQRSAAHRHALKHWQPCTSDIINEIPVDDPDEYLADPPIALQLAAWDWSGGRTQ